jgi:hypothetical protein
MTKAPPLSNGSLSVKLLPRIKNAVPLSDTPKVRDGLENIEQYVPPQLLTRHPNMYG